MKNRFLVLSFGALFLSLSNNVLLAQEVADPFDSESISAAGSSSTIDSVSTVKESTLKDVVEKEKETVNKDGEITYSPALTGTVQVGNSSLNVRLGVWGTIVGSLFTGNTVTITGQNGDWYIINLGGQKRYIHSDYVYVANKPKSTVSGGNSNSGGNSGGSSNSGENASRTSNNNGSYSTMYIMGDSRCVGMKFSDTKKNHVYIAKSSMGYNWFSQNYQDTLKKATANDVIVINFGVNDLWNSAKYIPLINSIADSTEAAVYFMTVNPVDEVKEKANGYGVKNSSINDFNQKMLKGLKANVNIIDSNNLLNQHGFSTSDGVHYTAATYKEILSIIENNL